MIIKIKNNKGGMHLMKSEISSHSPKRGRMQGAYS